MRCASALAPPDAGWLSPTRLLAWCGVLLAVETLAFLVLAAGVHGWIVPLPKPNSTDFVSFYAAGRMAWHGTAAQVYDMAAHYAAEQAATAPGITYEFFFYPPVFLIPLAPLSLLPYFAADVAFQAVTLGLYLAALRPLIAGRGWRWIVAVVAFPAVFWTFAEGQNAFLTAALFAVGLRLLDRRPVIAGMLLGCLCYKPHIGVLIPVALIAGRHWRAFAAAACCVPALIGLSVLLFGIEPWRAFVQHALSASGAYGSGRIDLAAMVTPFALVRLMGAPVRWASAAQTLATLAMAAIVWRTWSRPRPDTAAARAACLIAATMLAVPVLLLYDLMLAQVALAFLVARRDRWLALAAITVYAAPIICQGVARVTAVQTAPLIVAGLLALACARAAEPAPAQSGHGRD